MPSKSTALPAEAADPRQQRVARPSTRGTYAASRRAPLTPAPGRRSPPPIASPCRARGRVHGPRLRTGSRRRAASSQAGQLRRAQAATGRDGAAAPRWVAERWRRRKRARRGGWRSGGGDGGARAARSGSGLARTEGGASRTGLAAESGRAEERERLAGPKRARDAADGGRDAGMEARASGRREAGAWERKRPAVRRAGRRKQRQVAGPAGGADGPSMASQAPRRCTRGPRVSPAAGSDEGGTRRPERAGTKGAGRGPRVSPASQRARGRAGTKRGHAARGSARPATARGRAGTKGTRRAESQAGQPARARERAGTKGAGGGPRVSVAGHRGRERAGWRAAWRRRTWRNASRVLRPPGPGHDSKTDPPGCSVPRLPGVRRLCLLEAIDLAVDDEAWLRWRRRRGPR